MSFSKLKICVVLLVLCAVNLLGQVNKATLTGLGTDPSSAVVEGARVVAANLATGQEFTTTTSGGYYPLPALPIGEYEVRVEKEGFRKAVSRVTLDVGQKGRQDFTLSVGAANEQVTVESTGS